ncbi:MAG: NAD(P)H-hydrate dehydratase [Betaproteobacteria bacterium]|nr:NAD(P)H-hydrate dehydratase [Betaproteobacteria bacterium]
MDTNLYLSPALRRIEAAHAGEPLMERAGTAAADWAAELAGARGRPVLVLAGPGNNGGDAFVVARLLRERFFDVHVVFPADAGRLPADAVEAHARFVAGGGATLDAIPEGCAWGLVVDGLFGIGLARAPEGVWAGLVEATNRIAVRDACPLVALDCPSGLDADRGTAFSPAIRATHTLTFIAAKPGLFTGDGPDYCGEVRVAALELDPAGEAPADGRRVSLADFAGQLAPRPLNSHKGTFGSAGILGGGRSMAGAALLAGRAALKLGCGRVFVGFVDPDAPAVDPVQPELMLRRAKALLQADLTALACGPGLGTDDDARVHLEKALACPLSLVLDADALNLLADDAGLGDRLRARPHPTVMTPHPGEAARLLGIPVGEVQRARVSAAQALAARYGCCVALKGCGTVVAAVDGAWWVNSTGNPGMASAGMGDALTGMIVALLAQGWPATAATLAGVHLHGVAADRLVAAGAGPAGLTASEVIDAARAVFNGWSSGTGKAC